MYGFHTSLEVYFFLGKVYILHNDPRKFNLFFNLGDYSRIMKRLNNTSNLTNLSLQGRSSLRYPRRVN